MTPTVGYVGMTHLGLVSAAAAATKGFATIAADPDEALVASLRRCRLPVTEPGLAEILAQSAARLTFASDPAALGACDAVYIAPDVPVDEGGRAETGVVDRLLAWARRGARREASFVILSQVPPGFTRARHTADRPLYYQVETLVFGNAIERALRPERFIVGAADPARPLPAALASFLGAFGCPVLVMGYESAELAKIAINLCLVAQLSITNMLAEQCERIGADWREIAPALKLDRRIGPHAYLGPGLGLGGGNLLRDVATARAVAAAMGSDDRVLRACEANSRHRRDWALMRLHEELAGLATRSVAILGLAYKAGTGGTLNSPGLELARALRGTEVSVFDPVVPAALAAPARAAASALDACAGAHAVAVMTPWKEFRRLEPAALARTMRGRTVIDPFGVLGGRACNTAGLDHFALGAPATRAMTADGWPVVGQGRLPGKFEGDVPPSVDIGQAGIEG